MLHEQKTPTIGQDSRGSEIGSLCSAEPQEKLSDKGNLDKVLNAFQGLPEELRALPHWVLWRWETAKAKKDGTPGKLTKVPFQSNGKKAKPNDPSTWVDYDTALHAFRTGDFDGVGFCLMGAELAAFDIDDCRNPETGQIHPWALEKVRAAGSYAEVTVSGTGLRIIGMGQGDYVQRKLSVTDGVSCELYRNCERYIVMTGNRLEDSPAELLNVDEILDQTLTELDQKKPKKEKGSSASSTSGGSQGGDIEDLIKHGPGERYDGDRSRALWASIMGLLKQGYSPKAIASRLLDQSNKLSEHVYDQGNPEAYIERQIQKAIKDLEFETDKDDRPYKDSQANIKIALLKLGVTLTHNEFEDREIIDGLRGRGPALDDPSADRLWLLIDERFRFRPTKDFFITVLRDTARLNPFNPVRDYLNSLKWDGKPRLETWLTKYAGAEENPYTRAVGAITLTAAVRRVRNPGCKFDEMLYLISEQQGFGKSTLWQEMAVDPERFTDNLDMDASSKQVLEKTRGKWIVESSDLSGINGKTVEHLKALLSRQVDEDRLSYDRFVTRRPRQFIIVGTSNETKALRDPTGNRRFWPVVVEEIDLEAIKRDRDQIWAEAAAREAEGAAIRLPRELWEAAAAEQKKNTIDDAWEITLRDALAEHEDLAAEKGVGLRVSAQSLWRFLGFSTVAKLSNYDAQKVSKAMKNLGWERPNSNGTYKENGKIVTGFVKGPREDFLIVEMPPSPF